MRNIYYHKFVGSVFKIILSLIVFLIQIGAYAQEQNVQGTISAPDEGPLVGVNVVIKGTTTGTITDIDGNYRLALPTEVENPVLVFSYIGYETQEMVIGSQTIIDVSMNTDFTQLEEIVVVGYGTMRKKDLTGSVSQVKGDAIAKIAASSTTATLQGRAPGVNIESDGGRPGAEATIIIRGPGSFTNANPLYVIDGMLFNTMKFVNVNDIASVEVLKDASAAAIYGSRAANGVVIVTTKQGQAGPMQIDLDIRGGIQSVTHQLDLLNARQYCDVINQRDDLDGKVRARFCDTDFNANVDTDWQDLWLRDAPMWQTNIGISGGTEDLVYRFTGGFFGQDGIVESSSYDRLNLGVTSTYKKGKFTFSESLYYTRDMTDNNAAFRFNEFHTPVVPNPPAAGSRPALEGGYQASDVDYGWDANENRFGSEQLRINDQTNDLFNATISGEYEIIEGLTYKLNLGSIVQHAHSFNWMPTYYQGPGVNASNPEADLSESRTAFTSLLAENLLSYRKTFGNHRVNAVVGYTWQNDRAENMGSSVSDFPNNDVQVLSAGARENSISGTETENGLVSFLARANYSYLNKYLLTATLRRDGSSKFREDLRWGTFPSVSVGWVVSEESFFGVDAISNLKLRASYGEIGAQNIGDYAISEVLNISIPGLFGPGDGTRYTGFGASRFVFTDLVWESTQTTDIGLDMALLNDKFLITVDYFNKQSKDVLVAVPIPGTSGVAASPPIRNAADIENKGFEFEATYRKMEGDFHFDVGLNFTTLTNTVVALGENVNPILGGPVTRQADRATITRAGDPMGAFFGFLTDGLWQNQADIDGGTMPFARPGDQKYQDVNGDGVITADDRVVLGSAIPDVTYGISFNADYKNFDLNLFFYGVSGVDLYASHKYFTTVNFDGNYDTDVLNAWTPTNTDTNIPVVSSNLNLNGDPSDYYIYSGDFFRLNNMQVGYTLPSSVVEKIHLRNLRVYFSGQALFTITNYPGYSPEIGSQGRNTSFQTNQNLINRGVDQIAHPVPRVVMMGLQIGI